MKAALLIVLSLSALAFAGPAFNKDANQQQPQHMTGAQAKGPVADILKQWCVSSEMSAQELTSSFKKLVAAIKSNPSDQAIEQAVMGERVCPTGSVADISAKDKSADLQAHELIKDVYMDALISCKSRDCTQQLLKIVNSNKVDTVRASYYMTRVAVTEKDDIKDEQEIKQLADSFIQSIDATQSESIERQKLFATTALIGKWIQAKPSDAAIKQTAEQVAKTIVDRYIKPVTEQEIQQYQQQQQQSSQTVNEQLVKKIAKRSAALKALANIPGHVLKQSSDVSETIVAIAQNKQELVTVRQSAIECLEQNDQALTILKQVTFDQQEPIEVRVAAYRALMTVAYAGEMKDDAAKQQLASDIVDQVVKHCQDSRNQQQDDQFVLYAISHLDNLRTSQQPEHAAIKQCIADNKQHYMQIQVLCNKFKQQLSDVRRSSRNYKLEQEFNQLESGLIVEGDLIYESKNANKQQQQQQVLPKVIRVNMSMPVMGETVNVVEITVRQNAMDEEILSALNIVGTSGKSFTSGAMSKVVDSFKSSVEKQQQQQQQQQQTKDYSNNKQEATEADLTIKVDGCTIVYLCVDDFKAATKTAIYHNQQQQQQQHQRNTRSVYSSSSIVDDVIEYLKRKPVAFNRGFNFNLNERIAKVLDVDANIIAGLRFESRATGQSKDNFEIVAQMEPRFSFEAIVGPAKLTNKKLLQRLSTKTAVGLRLRFKKDELVDVQVDLPMNTMDLFTIETQMVEKNARTSTTTSTSTSTSNKYDDIDVDSYSYLPESIYGQEDIYSVASTFPDAAYYNTNKIAKRSIFSSSDSNKSIVGKLFAGKSVSRVLEIPDEIARATGLKAKLRLAASPKDLSLFVSAAIEKVEPQMQGFRVQVQKVERSHDQKSYLVTFTTPGSRTDRTVQMRVVKQSSSQRTIVKSDIQSAKATSSVLVEFVHDGRQYSAKTEIASRGPAAQWRHAAELGLVSSASSAARSSYAFAYKPYVNIDSSALKRPIQMSGQIAYQQSPKSVISYELRSATTGDYLQGKIIVDQRDSSANMAMSKRSASAYYSVRRAMQSPLELLLKKDLTLTSELLAQVNEHAFKVHNMVDWDCDKYAVHADYSASYKDLRHPSEESLVTAQMKFDDAQQVLTVERKCAQQERKDFRLQLASQVKSASSHQMLAELRYNGRRQSTLAYKHQVDLQKMSSTKYEAQIQVELVDSEHKLNEKLTGRARVSTERRNKSVDAELSSRAASAKVDFDFESLAQHQLIVVAKTERLAHKTELRNNKRQFSVQSTTTKRQGQLAYKLVAELTKEQPRECKLVLEVPAKRSHLALDVKLTPAKLSSVALQTPRFATKAEFSFETIARPYSTIFKPLTSQNWRFKTNHKDLINKEAYWMDSALNVAELDKRASYLRLDSPVYRTDLEFDPRDFSAKLGLFARSKRSVDAFDQIYSNKDSAINQLMDKLSLNTNLNANKLWMVRSIISSPYAMDSLKQKARRALFEFADRRQSHRHSVDYSPADQRINFQLEHEPAVPMAFPARRLAADLSTSWSRPSRMSLESDWMNMDVEAKPFDGDETFAKVSAVSRHPRAAFKKHDSEYRYNKADGHKAWMKHQDAKDQRHELRFESDASPKKYAKASYDSDKHGRASWEHKWRKHAEKRHADQEDVWANKLAFERAHPDNQMVHRSSLSWQEPIKMVESRRRDRRSVADYLDAASAAADHVYGRTGTILARLPAFERYSPIEYLKHTSGRLNSQTFYNNDLTKAAYNLDFDYQPHQAMARLNVNMPDDLLHSSSLEYQPSERLYKLQSKLVDQRTPQEPIYDLYYTTKPIVDGLASANQEPVFINSDHPMLEQPISSQSLMAKLFKQPMKLDYSDKYGRQASFDYDHSPLSLARKYDNLRQKRAAVYYKDEANDVEHQTTFDFYPEMSFLGKMKPQFKRQSGDVVFKTSTKYGPVIVRADSNDANNNNNNKDSINLDIQTPIMNVKLIADDQSDDTKLIKMYVDNKSQKVELSKLVRKSPIEWVRNAELIKKVARKVDSSRFEHETELLVSIIDAILKIKSSTKLDERQVLAIDAHFDADQNKAFAKVNGERVRGQLVADLITKTADLIVDVDQKRTFAHETRLVRTSDKFYSLQSMTSHKSKPVFKLTGKISSMVFEEPSHLWTSVRGAASRRAISNMEPHMSTFEAVLYEPNEYHITGQYDCVKQEARVVFKNIDENKVQETIVKFDQQNDDVLVNCRLSSPYGEMYVTKAKVNLPGLVADLTKKDQKCQYKPESCKSEIIYSNYATNDIWAAKHLPGKFISIESPRTGRQTFQLSY